MQSLEQLVIEWAKEKGLTSPENARNQLLKFYEEAGEIAGAILKNNPDALESEIGDVLVTLVIFCHQNGTDLKTCLQKAYDKISKRTGQTINGSFVKDENKSCTICAHDDGYFAEPCKSCNNYSNFEPL